MFRQLSHDTVEVTKNICCIKSEKKFYSGYKNIDNQIRSSWCKTEFPSQRGKSCEYHTGELGISQSSVIYNLQDFKQMINIG